MKKIIKVMFPTSKELSFYYSLDFNLNIDDLVVVETESGVDVAIVKKAPYFELEENIPSTLLKVIRKVTADDKAHLLANAEVAMKALDIAKKYSDDLKLDMNFVDCYYTFDKSQLIFSFVADSRVDFRELAEKLAQKYKTRIELRQIGVRDKAKKSVVLVRVDYFYVVILF